MTSEPTDRDLDADVIVVGAGPGGTSLSYLLARSGVDATLVERHTDLSREFRGYAFQPAVLPLFDRMGVLEDVLDLDARRVETGSLVAYGTSYEVVDYTAAEGPYGHGLFLEQPPLLRPFVDRASRYEGFTYRDGTTVTDLRREDGRAVGVGATDREANADLELFARLVVGADGRFSAVRELAGIDPGLPESDIELAGSSSRGRPPSGRSRPTSPTAAC